ncbi:CRISPR-associated exonuclease, Cas4 family [Chelatococcus sambhunathii]|uniref:CRISPR-associated exonuclease Cas4 n=2 Tax=Chelatococcus TaxID=28209 RepID=A0AAC9JV72_9HYPH|nr:MULTISPECIES: CRISPR-associated protein Cas4 [Chelatococcus]APF37817.1 CRISPR-associated protein Cas4 [Chelatococcus daeguensis]CUA85397.1 CRISPR-associated exonuclease, Cas4 family [Chelatococcus sambhunathii]
MADDGLLQPDERDAEPIPLSALQHAVYCLRQAALIHLERLWAENRFTAEGHVMHVASGRPDSRRARGVRRETALAIASRRLGIAGVADLVEFHRGPDGEIPYPVEFKRGRPKLHRADEVQLCAQGLCLEEMTGRPVPEGALFYGETKRRIAVPFDADLRRLTEETIADLRRIFRSLATPKAVWRAERCRACSLIELCRPKAGSRSARAWREGMVASLLDGQGGAG